MAINLTSSTTDGLQNQHKQGYCSGTHNVAVYIEWDLNQGPESREGDWKHALIPLI